MRQYGGILKDARAVKEGKVKPEHSVLKSMLQGYHYHPTLALRGALYYELFGVMLSRDECQNLDLDWVADVALAQADLLFEAN